MPSRGADTNHFSSFSQWNRALSNRSSNRSSTSSTGTTITHSHSHPTTSPRRHRRGFSLPSFLTSSPDPAATTTTTTTTAASPSTTTTRTTTTAAMSTAAHAPSNAADMSKRLARLIKSTNGLIAAHRAACTTRLSLAAQLAAWGEHTGDAAVGDVADKLGALLGAVGEQERAYAGRLDEARVLLKAVRNTERSVAGVRKGRARVEGEIERLRRAGSNAGGGIGGNGGVLKAGLKGRWRRGGGSAAGGGARGDGETGPGGRLVTLEQELVRVEAEGLVAEAQLANVTRQKLKEAYTTEFLATIERADKQLLLARHGLRLLQLLDDTPIIPGDVRPPYTDASQARQILNDAEDDLRDWRIDGLLVMSSPSSDEEDDNAKPNLLPLSAQTQGKLKGKQKDADKENRREGEKAIVMGTEGGCIVAGPAKDFELGGH